jgi:hypothetical protein
MRRVPALSFGMLLLALAALGLATAPATGAPLLAGPNIVFLPYIELPPLPTATPTPTETNTPAPTLTPTATPSPANPCGTGPVEWDPRLDQRQARVICATVAPGEGFWRLVKGVWYAENEPPFAGQHHIWVDTLDPAGARQPGVRFEVTSPDRAQSFGSMTTELKPGDLYAANFPMWMAGKSYRTSPSDGHPADEVSDLGMGSIELPNWTIHTSYGFVWQWTTAATATPQPKPTETPVLEGVRP